MAGLFGKHRLQLVDGFDVMGTAETCNLQQETRIPGFHKQWRFKLMLGSGAARSWSSRDKQSPSSWWAGWECSSETRLQRGCNGADRNRLVPSVDDNRLAEASVPVICLNWRGMIVTANNQPRGEPFDRVIPKWVAGDRANAACQRGATWGFVHQPERSEGGAMLRSSFESQSPGCSGKGSRSPANAVSSPIPHGKPTATSGPSTKASPWRTCIFRPVSPELQQTSHQLAAS